MRGSVSLLHFIVVFSFLSKNWAENGIIVMAVTNPEYWLVILELTQLLEVDNRENLAGGYTDLEPEGVNKFPNSTLTELCHSYTG